MFTIVNSIGELTDPVTQNHHASLMTSAFDRTWQLDVKFDMAMSEDEVVDIRMLCDILFGKDVYNLCRKRSGYTRDSFLCRCCN